jgi:glycosyltransferase involved in cell wall biosynthesis
MAKIVILSRQISHYHHARFQALAAAAIDFCVISLSNEGHFSGFVSDAETNYTAHRLFSGRAPYAKAVAEGKVARDVMAVLAREKPTVVAVAGWASAESFAAIQFARRTGAAIVMMSDSQFEDSHRAAWREAMKSRIVQLCDSGFVAGRAHAQYLTRLGIPANRITLGYDVVDNAHFVTGADAARADEVASRAKQGLPARYLLASARFVPKNNLAALIAAFGAARRDRTDAPDLVSLGDGPLRTSLEAVAGPGVHLPGFVAYDRLPAVYGLADGFVHASLSDQWGLVISEAAASGLPLALSRAAGATAELLIEGENGVVFEPHDTADIVRALGVLMDLPLDSRRAFGVASRRQAAGWGLQRYVDGFLTAAHMARCAAGGAARNVALVDRALMRILSRRLIDSVS